MANDTSLTFSLYGKDVSATKSLQDVGNAANTASGHFSKIKDIAAGIGLEQGVQALGEKVLNFGKESIAAYQSVGKEVKLLQRYTGDTAEEMSKLRFAAEESGVSAETLAMGLGKMSKAASSTAGEKKFEAIGISVKDMNGHMKSASDIFTEVAGKLGGMQNGVEKTNAIMQIFGRSGMELAPLLNKGADGIAKFKEEAQKFGLVLGQDNLDAIQKNIMAHRELHAAVEGMQVQLGQYLYPAITAITKGFSEVVPVIAQALKPAFEALGSILKPIVEIIGKVFENITAVSKGFSENSNMTTALSNVMTSFAPVFEKVKILFELVGKFLIENLLPVIKDLWAFTSTYLVPLFADALNIALNVISKSLSVIIVAVKDAIAIFTTFESVAKGVASVIISVFSGIAGTIRSVINGIIDMANTAIAALDSIKVHIPGTNINLGVDIPKIPKLADGGIVNRPTIAMIGEAGAEAVVPLSKMGGMGGGMNVTIHVAGSVIQEKDLAITIRDGIAQLMRRRGLDPAILGV